MSRTGGSIYSGLVSNECCVFATNDILGPEDEEGAIVKINGRCAALVLTTGQSQLERFLALRKYKNVLDEAGREDGLWSRTAESIAASFETEFKADPVFAGNPLPFLLLLVGYAPGSSSLEHIFMRNRVVTVIPKQDKREYVTGFDMQPAVAAKSLFYGHAELARFWARPLKDARMAIPDLSLLAYYALTETRKMDNSIAPGIRMAALSADEGFAWIPERRIQRLSGLAERFDGSIREGLAKSLVPVAGSEF
jgi:hypothetical protein